MGLFGTPLSYFDQAKAYAAYNALVNAKIAVGGMDSGYVKDYNANVWCFTIKGNTKKAFEILDQKGLR